MTRPNTGPHRAEGVAVQGWAGLTVCVAWSLLTDLSRVADCLPGAKLTEAVDERTYRGEVGVKLGPVGMNFLGEMHFTLLDEQRGHAVATASARDSRNRGNADATIDFTLAPDDQ